MPLGALFNDQQTILQARLGMLLLVKYTDLYGNN